MMVEPEEVEGPYPYQWTTAAITTAQGSIIAKSLLLALGCIVYVVVDRRSSLSTHALSDVPWPEERVLNACTETWLVLLHQCHLTYVLLVQRIYSLMISLISNVKNTSWGGAAWEWGYWCLHIELQADNSVIHKCIMHEGVPPNSEWKVVV